MYWSRVSECVGSCAWICLLNCRNVLFAFFGMCWSLCLGLFLNGRNVLVVCFGMCWQLCSDLCFESSECRGRVFLNVLIAVLGCVF